MLGNVAAHKKEREGERARSCAVRSSGSPTAVKGVKTPTGGEEPGCDVLGCFVISPSACSAVNHPLLLARAHGRRREARGEVGQPRRSMSAPLGGAHMGGRGHHCTHLRRFVSLFEVGCFVEAEKGKGGNNMSGMSGAVEGPILPAANSEREQ